MVEQKKTTANNPFVNKVHLYQECHNACPLVRIGTPHHLSPARECAPPPEPKGGELGLPQPPHPQMSVPPLWFRGGGHIRTHLPARGWGVPILTTGKKPSTLSALCISLLQYISSTPTWVDICIGESGSEGRDESGGGGEGPSRRPGRWVRCGRPLGLDGTVSTRLLGLYLL